MDVTGGSLIVVLAAGGLAGLVRGFSGFGASLTFVPIAGRHIPPADAIVLISLVDAFVALALVPGAARLAQHRKVIALAAGAAIAIPVGAYLLSRLDVLTVRWVLCALVALSVVVLASGWRYRREPPPPAAVGIGAIAGFMGGIGGLFGPAVMVFLMSSDAAARVVRANIIVFLAWMIVVASVAYVYFGLFRVELVWQALMLAPAFGVGVLVGVYGFGRARAAHYRSVVYTLIGLAAVTGLPILDDYLR